MTNKLLEKIQFNNDKIILYAPDSLKYITDEMIRKTLERMPEIYNFFGKSTFRKLQINLFDDLQKFRKFIICMRDGDENSLPEYAKGTFDQGMINAYVEPNIIKNSPLYISKIYNPSHELIHILYWELILKDNFSKRVIWLDEGLAQYLSGQKDEINENDKFKDFFFKVVNKTKEYPSLNTIKHGSSFVNENYNGYELSYLCIKYLFDTKTIEEIRNIVYSYEESIKIGQTILEDTIEYYKGKFNFKIK